MTQTDLAHELVQKLALKPHPEGGFYKETYRCEESIPATALHERYSAPRSISTSIYYMLTTETFSAMHRVKSDEIYHFYSGAPLQLLLLFPDGTSHIEIIGDPLAGHSPQFLIPRNCWQGSRLLPGSSANYGLIGATVAPGFDFADFELGSREQLCEGFPSQRDLIAVLTRV